MVGVAAELALDEKGQIRNARVALGAAAPTPLLTTASAAQLAGQVAGVELWRAAGRTAAEEAQPLADLRASVAFRRHLVDQLTQEALQNALANIGEKTGEMKQ